MLFAATLVVAPLGRAAGADRRHRCSATRRRRPDDHDAACFARLRAVVVGARRDQDQWSDQPECEDGGDDLHGDL